MIKVIDRISKREISLFDHMSNSVNNECDARKRQLLIEERFKYLSEKKRKIKELRQKKLQIEEVQGIWERNLRQLKLIRDIDADPCLFLVEEMICPITQDIMIDPALDNQGNSFEYEALLKWIKKKPFSPVTKQPLLKHEIRKNINLRNIIVKYKESSLKE